MKYPVKTKIDNTDLQDMIVVESFTGYLMILGIKAAEQANIAVQVLMEDGFCSECEQDKDNCECHMYNGTYMREYDDGADYED